MERKDISEVVHRLREIKRRRLAGERREVASTQRIKEGQEGMNWTEVAKAENEVKSHTSFLCFAVKYKRFE